MNAPVGRGDSFGTFLRALRLDRDLTQEELADRAELSVRAVGDLERGRSIPHRDTVGRLCSALGLDEESRQRLTALARTGWAAQRRTGAMAERQPGAGSAHARVDVVPAQLPPDTAGFIGRGSELADLAELIDGTDEERSREQARTAMAVISGPAGSGKTALAVQFSQAMAARFPDGQLYIDLRGFAAAPALSAHAALGVLLEGLGVGQDVMPDGTEQRSSLYRSILAGRRMLVLLDNAWSPTQVNPLLPGTPKCLTLITSRKRMDGIVACYGARPVSIGVLDPPDAIAVLAGAIADDRVAQDPQSAQQLAALCGFLPLALRITAANLRANPGQRLTEMVAALASEDRLTRLQVEEGPAVTATLDLSYRRLDELPARMFGLLGLVPGPDFTAETAAALADLTIVQSARQLEHLLAMHLIQRSGHARFNFHDLVRLYACQLACQTSSEDERCEALRRLAGLYIGLADHATRHLDGRRLLLPRSRAGGRPVGCAPGTEDRPVTSLDDERPNMVALARSTAAVPRLRQTCWELAHALDVYFQVRRHVADSFTVAQAGLSAAVCARDRMAEAAMRYSLANGYSSQGFFQRAADEYQRALRGWEDNGWRPAEAEVASSLAKARIEIDPPARSIENYEHALRLWRELGDLAGEARTLSSFGGDLLWKLGRLPDAYDAMTRAVAINEELARPHPLGACLVNLGNIAHELGWLEEALTALTRALHIARETGARATETIAMCDLGGVHRDLARFPEALSYGHRALELSRDIGDSRIEAECRNALADCHLRLAQAAPAQKYAEQALRITREIGYRYGQARAEIRLSSALLLSGDTASAARQAASAVTLTRRHGYRMLEGNALTVLARTCLAQSNAMAATTHATRAVSLLQDTGHRPGEDAARAVLGQASG